MSRKYLNCHRDRNKNSLTYHRRNTKNIFHSFSKQKHNITGRREDQIVRLSCQKYYVIHSKTAENYFSYQSSHPF